MGPDLPVISYEFYNSNCKRIDPEIKAEWIAALRSGKYEQGRYTLRTPDNKFCCLGVYCDMKEIPFTIRKREIQVELEVWALMDVAHYGKGYLNESSTSIPPSHAIRFVGEETPTRLGPRGFAGGHTIFFCVPQGPIIPNEPVDDEPVAYTLPMLNDDGLTFNQIADIIDYFL